MAGIVRLDATGFNKNMEHIEESLTELKSSLSLIGERAGTKTSIWEGEAKEQWINGLEAILQELGGEISSLQKLGARADMLGHRLERTHLKASRLANMPGGLNG